MDRIYLTELFDCYEKLLTEKEKNCFKDYYEEDLSLAEIAKNNNVSRSAIYRKIKNVEDKLDNYEEKLQLNLKRNMISELMNINNLEEIKARLEKLYL